MQAGVACFPGKPWMHILHSNFLIQVQNLYQAGQSQLVAAKKMSPGLVGWTGPGCGMDVLVLGGTWVFLVAGGTWMF